MEFGVNSNSTSMLNLLTGNENSEIGSAALLSYKMPQSPLMGGCDITQIDTNVEYVLRRYPQYNSFCLEQRQKTISAYNTDIDIRIAGRKGFMSTERAACQLVHIDEALKIHKALTVWIESRKDPMDLLLLTSMWRGLLWETIGRRQGCSAQQVEKRWEYLLSSAIQYVGTVCVPE